MNQDATLVRVWVLAPETSEEIEVSIKWNETMDNLKPGPHKFRRFAEACAARGAEKADLTPAFNAAKKLLGFN